MQQLGKNEACPHCGRFANRGISIDIIIIDSNKILLIQRGVDPHKGYWAIPGGYLEWNETTEEAAKREVKEEVGLDVIETKLVGVYSSPARHPKQTITIVYLARTSDKKIKHGDDAVDAKWFSLEKLPERMAFDHEQIIQDAVKLIG